MIAASSIEDAWYRNYATQKTPRLSSSYPQDPRSKFYRPEIFHFLGYYILSLSRALILTRTVWPFVSGLLDRPLGLGPGNGLDPSAMDGERERNPATFAAGERYPPLPKNFFLRQAGAQQKNVLYRLNICNTPRSFTTKE